MLPVLIRKWTLARGCRPNSVTRSTSAQPMTLPWARSMTVPSSLLCPVPRVTPPGRGRPVMSTSLRRFGPCLAAALLAAAFLLPGGCGLGGGTAPPAASSDGYLFCFWNVENLFDDHRDKRHKGVDDDFDSRYANNPEVLQTKLRNLSKVLLSLNGG